VQGAKAFYNKWVSERQGATDPCKSAVKLALRKDLREYLQPNRGLLNLDSEPYWKGLHGTPYYILV